MITHCIDISQLFFESFSTIWHHFTCCPWSSLILARSCWAWCWLFCVPVLYLLIPDLFYGKPNWYDLWQAYFIIFIIFSSCLMLFGRFGLQPLLQASSEEHHSWGLMRDGTDALVVMLKFHPICKGTQGPTTWYLRIHLNLKNPS